jgi:hypothetical protein
MTSVLILAFLAGTLAVGGVAHFLAGVHGTKVKVFGMQTPAVWGVFLGWLELVGAALLWHVAPMAAHPRAAFVAVAVGVLVAGLVMSLNWLGNLVHKK